MSNFFRAETRRFLSIILRAAVLLAFFLYIPSAALKAEYAKEGPGIRPAEESKIKRTPKLFAENREAYIKAWINEISIQVPDEKEEVKIKREKENHALTQDILTDLRASDGNPVQSILISLRELFWPKIVNRFLASPPLVGALYLLGLPLLIFGILLLHFKPQTPTAGAETLWLDNNPWNPLDLLAMYFILMLVPPYAAVIFGYMGHHHEMRELHPSMTFLCLLTALQGMGLIGVFALVYANKGKELFFQTLKRPPLLRSLSGLILSYPAFFIFSAAVSLWYMYASLLFGFLPNEQGVVDAIRNPKSPAAGNMLALQAVVLAPLVEELIFRVAGYSLLRKYVKAFPAIIINGIAFSLIHQEASQFLALFFIGVTLALLYEWTRSYWVCVGFHALHNGVNVFLLLFMNG